ncbi:MAG: hypothetical protein L0H79_06005 [Intrasporangium sp.]|uniref:hypothetical protein n=1 Tax=Intrasporangium sp. TaxID=1925024 RepID=UPI0026492F28|nr:hypothetical protein [Intrasporangium sp.]MDN5795292.1 hypothetical protein [Intrasporangium sp.]
MAHFSIEPDGVRSARAVLADDPRALRHLASALSTACAQARTTIGSEWAGLLEALERFGSVHAHGIDAVAEASAALGGDLDLLASRSAATELAIAAAIGSVHGALDAA